jgi:hypothetical protein
VFGPGSAAIGSKCTRTVAESSIGLSRYSLFRATDAAESKHPTACAIGEGLGPTPAGEPRPGVHIDVQRRSFRTLKLYDVRIAQASGKSGSQERLSELPA